MRVVIIGGSGQLGHELAEQWRDAEVLRPSSTELDLGSATLLERLVALNPDLVLLPGAYTNVDGCTLDPERAFQINTLGPKYAALACRRLDIPLLYVSTNEVFNGRASEPYREYDQPDPINAYGRSKWGGEQVVLQHAPAAYIVRVAWLFGGERNFVRTMLRLGRERLASGEPLKVVDDEIGSPTYAPDAAQAMRKLIDAEVPGIYHIVNQGSCSRFELAQATVEAAGIDPRLEPIRLADYQRPSTPPSWSPLHNGAAAALGIQLRPWREALAEFVGNISQ